MLFFSTFSVQQTLPENRLQLSFILLLSNITFKFIVNQTLPKISYLTYLVSRSILHISFWSKYLSGIPKRWFFSINWGVWYSYYFYAHIKIDFSLFSGQIYPHINGHFVFSMCMARHYWTVSGVLWGIICRKCRQIRPHWIRCFVCRIQRRFLYDMLLFGNYYITAILAF